MDRGGFVEFVQWTFVERKTFGSKVVTAVEVPRSRNAIAQSINLVSVH